MQTWPFSNADSVKARVNQAVRDVTAQLTGMQGDSSRAESCQQPEMWRVGEILHAHTWGK